MQKAAETAKEEGAAGGEDGEGGVGGLTMQPAAVLCVCMYVQHPCCIASGKNVWCSESLRHAGTLHSCVQ